MRRNPDRIPEILKLLREVWEANPDQRFFQLLTDLGFFPPSIHGIDDPYHIEDDIVRNTLYNRARLRERNAREAKVSGLKTDRPGRKGKAPRYRPKGER